MTESNQMKTGTTTVGIVCKDCVVLAADMRTTAGYQIMNGDAEKVFSLTPKIAMTWAGSVAANQMLIKYLRGELKLRHIRSGRETTVKEAINLLRNWVYSVIRQPSMMQDISHFLMGGTDKHGVHLYDLFPDGSLTKIDKFISTGSGSVYVYGFLEKQYTENLSQEQGIALALDAVDTAMQKDIASGNGVNVFVIDKNGARKVSTKKVNTHIQ